MAEVAGEKVPTCTQRVGDHSDVRNASTSFPGFFPPLLLTASDVGADESQFPPHRFTDGANYDNLGIRMFRYTVTVATA